MKKKETLWELIKRLDEEAGAYNASMHKANHLFDTAAKETAKVLDKHQRDLHKTITRLQKALKAFNNKKTTSKKSKDSESKDAGKK